MAFYLTVIHRSPLTAGYVCCFGSRIIHNASPPHFPGDLQQATIYYCLIFKRKDTKSAPRGLLPTLCSLKIHWIVHKVCKMHRRFIQQSLLGLEKSTAKDFQYSTNVSFSLLVAQTHEEKVQTNAPKDKAEASPIHFINSVWVTRPIEEEVLKNARQLYPFKISKLGFTFLWTVGKEPLRLFKKL